MLKSTKQFGAAALSGLALLALAVPTANAQIFAGQRPIPGVAQNAFQANRQFNRALGGQFARNNMITNQLYSQLYNPFIPGSLGYGQFFNNPNVPMPLYNTLNNNTWPYPTPFPYGGGGYGGYGGWGMPYELYPYGSFLQGTSSLVNANAQYQLTIQQARLVQQQVESAKLDLRRRMNDELRYERSQQPTPAEIREREIAGDLAVARSKEPPVTDVLSGKSLNSLLDHLAAQQAKGFKGPNVAVEEDTLKHINVTVKNSRANPGLLKNDGKLSWPQALRADEFAEPRDRLEKVLKGAVQQVKFNNPVEQGDLKDLRSDLAKLQEALVAQVGELTPSQYVESRRYLNQLGDALKALEDPNASNFFTQNWVAKGKNVGELVKNMADKGLVFASSVPGDEASYRALHAAMAAYDAGMQQMVKQ